MPICLAILSGSSWQTTTTKLRSCLGGHLPELQIGLIAARSNLICRESPKENRIPKTLSLNAIFRRSPGLIPAKTKKRATPFGFCTNPACLLVGLCAVDIFSPLTMSCFAKKDITWCIKVKFPAGKKSRYQTTSLVFVISN